MNEALSKPTPRKSAPATESLALSVIEHMRESGSDGPPPGRNLDVKPEDFTGFGGRGTPKGMRTCQDGPLAIGELKIATPAGSGLRPPVAAPRLPPPTRPAPGREDSTDLFSPIFRPPSRPHIVAPPVAPVMKVARPVIPTDLGAWLDETLAPVPPPAFTPAPTVAPVPTPVRQPAASAEVAPASASTREPEPAANDEAPGEATPEVVRAAAKPGAANLTIVDRGPADTLAPADTSAPAEAPADTSAPASASSSGAALAPSASTSIKIVISDLAQAIDGATRSATSLTAPVPAELAAESTVRERIPAELARLDVPQPRLPEPSDATAEDLRGAGLGPRWGRIAGFALLLLLGAGGYAYTRLQPAAQPPTPAPPVAPRIIEATPVEPDPDARPTIETAAEIIDDDPSDSDASNSKTRARQNKSDKADACPQVAARSEAARKDGDWVRLERLTRDPCWAKTTAAKRLRVKALFELGRFDACVRVGGGSRDREIEKWTQTCTLRLDRDPL